MVILLESPGLNIGTTLANFNWERKTPYFIDLSMICVAEIPHEQYGSALFIRNDAVCESFSTHTSGNIEIIQAQMNGLTVTSLYKPPNEEYSFGGNTISNTIKRGHRRLQQPQCELGIYNNRYQWNKSGSME